MTCLYAIDAYPMTGHYLNDKLDQAGIDLPNLARRLGISPQVLNRLLDAQDVSVGTLVRIANATGKDVNYFLEGYSPQPSVDYETLLE